MNNSGEIELYVKHCKLIVILLEKGETNRTDSQLVSHDFIDLN